jgi:hypothetical protein
MDLTLEQIFSSSLAPFSYKEESQQRREQTQLISNRQKCTPKEVRNAFLALGSLDDSLRKVYQESFNDPEVLRLLTCIANATVSISLPNNIAIRRIRHWISKLIAVGSTSLQDYIFQSTLDNVDGVYLTKSNKPPRKSKDIIHEYFVGAFGTNKVREKGIPNFSYLFGISRALYLYCRKTDEFCHGARRVITTALICCKSTFEDQRSKTCCQACTQGSL